MAFEMCWQRAQRVVAPDTKTADSQQPLLRAARSGDDVTVTGRSGVVWGSGSGSASRRTRLLIVAGVTVLVALYIFVRSRPRASSRGGGAGPSAPGTGFDAAYSLAVCYSGQVRALRRVYEQNMAMFRTFDRSARVFVYLDLLDAVPLPSGTRYIHNHTRSELRSALAALGAEPKYFNASQVSVPQRTECIAALDPDITRYSHHYHDFYASRQCYQQVQAAEAARGRKFTWVLRLRPGVYVDIRRPPLSAANKIHMAGYDIALIPRPLAPVFFNLVDAYDPQNCQLLEQDRHDACGYSYIRDSNDCLAVRWLKLHGLRTTSNLYVNRRIVVEE